MASVDIQKDQEDRKAFGAFLAQKRLHTAPKKIKQSQILKYLPGWSPASYSRLEDGITAPNFDDLAGLFAAFRAAEIPFSFAEMRQFVTLAHRRIDLQQTYKYERTEDEWAQLLLDLLREDDERGNDPSRHQRSVSQPDIADIAYLVDRPLWRKELLGLLAPERGKKLLVVRGTAGIGKSSEMSWLATKLLGQSSCQVVFCNLRSREKTRTPEEAFLMFLGAVFSDLGMSYPQLSSLSFQDQTTLFLDRLERCNQRLFLLIDHGETLLQEGAQLAPCWKYLLSAFLRSRHQAKVVMATRLWLTWTGNDPLFVDETTIPPLSLEQSISLLRQLGLNMVPTELLQEVYHTIGGTPLMLEWVAAWVKQPLPEDWGSFEMEHDEAVRSIASPIAMTKMLQRLLAGPRVFGGPPESVVAPFLERLLSTQLLSSDARYVLHVLSVAGIPLAKSALEVICRAGPGSYEELRRASLVVASRARAQLLPMIAVAVIRSLTSEQIEEAELLLIEAYTTWLTGGMLYEREAGGVVAELALLLLKYHQMLNAAQLLIRYGWLAFGLGHTRRLAEYAIQVLEQEKWPKTEDNGYGALLLHYFLSPFLGKQVDARQKAIDYYAIRDAALAERIVLQPPTFVSTTHNLMQQAMNALCFEEAQTLLDACCAHVEPFLQSSIDLRASLLEKRAWMLSVWSEYRNEQGNEHAANKLLEQALILYSQCCALLDAASGQPSLTDYFLKKRHARNLNFWGYYLLKARRYELALQVLRKSLDLQERGYAEVDGLAPVYGDISQAFIGLGRFQEALYFDEKAYNEAQRLANAGYTFSKEELHIYRINRGILYLRLGRIEEAEALLREAIPLVHLRRRSYKVAAQRILKEEIEMRSPPSHYQLDWRWVDRYRELASFDGYWWLAAAGPFTEDEKQQWERLFSTNIDEAAKEQLEALIDQSRVRELDAALIEQREPYLCYPAIDIVDVRRRIVDLQALQTEIDAQEPNAIVRRLYYGTIEEELNYLRFIEATYEGDSKSFWKYNLRINPKPTPEDMSYALSRVRHFVVEGIVVAERGEGIELDRRDALRETSSRLIQFLSERLYLSLDWSYDEDEAQELLDEPPLSSAPRRMVSAQTAKRFFEAALRESGYEGWQVVIDRHSAYAHIEQALRHFYLPESAISLQQIKDLLSHELLVHVARCVSGQRSILGLLGIHTERSLETEEGLGAYYEIKVAHQTGQPHDETGVWFGTLATGLASGVLVPPQRFLSLVTFFEEFIHLYRLLKRPDQDVLTARKLAHKHALARGLRTYRGLSDLQQMGMCNCKDAHYVPGLRKVERAVTERGESVLDELAVGVVAVENLSLLRELGIVAVPQPLRQIVQDPGLDAYILSFDEDGGKVV